MNLQKFLSLYIQSHTELLLMHDELDYYSIYSDHHTRLDLYQKLRYIECTISSIKDLYRIKVYNINELKKVLCMFSKV